MDSCPGNPETPPIGLTSPPKPFWDAFRNDYWRQPTAEIAKALEESFKLAATHANPLMDGRHPEHLDPDCWTVSQAGLDRPAITTSRFVRSMRSDQA